MIAQTSSFEIPTKFSILALLWGVSFLLVLRVEEAFGWAAGISFRAFIASGALIILAFLTNRKLNFSVSPKHFAIVGVTTVSLQLVGMYIAVPRIGTALTAILIGTIPLFSSVIGKLMNIETISKKGYIGLLLGFMGIVLLVGFPQEILTSDFYLGVVICIIGCVSAAFGSNYSRLKLASVGNWEIVIGAFFFGGLFTLPLIFFVPFNRAIYFTDWVYISALAIFCSSICYVIYFSLVAKIGATRSISVEFLVTVVAVLIGGLYLKEIITMIQLLGAVIVIFGCILILDLIQFKISEDLN